MTQVTPGYLFTFSITMPRYLTQDEIIRVGEFLRDNMTLAAGAQHPENLMFQLLADDAVEVNFFEEDSLGDNLPDSSEEES